MKIPFKIPAIATLSGLVLCAGVFSASAENAAANKQDYSPCIDITLNDGTVFTVPENQLGKCLPFIDILQNDPDNINIQHVEASPITYYGLSDGTLLPVLVEYLEECAPYVNELLLIDEENGIENIPDFTTKEAIDRILSMSIEDFRDSLNDTRPEYVYIVDSKTEFLTEYPEEFLPYVQELERINKELGTDYTFSIEVSEADEAVDFYTSLSRDDFSSYIYDIHAKELEHDNAVTNGDSGTVGVVEDTTFTHVITHSGGYWYFQERTTVPPDSDHYSEGAFIQDENGEISVIPSGELSPDNKIETHEYGVDETREPHDFTETPDVGNTGVYRGDGWVYSCDYAYDMTSVREAELNYDEQKTKYEQMLPTDYTDIPQEVTYGIMTDIDGLMVSHMKYVSDGKTEIYTDREGEKVAELNYINTQNAEIVFENGSIASEEDLISGTAVLVEYDMINETYPGKMHCTRIVILQQ